MPIGLTIGHWLPDFKYYRCYLLISSIFNFDELALKDKKPLELLVLDASSRSALGTSLSHVDKECINDCSCAIVELVA